MDSGKARNRRDGGVLPLFVEKREGSPRPSATPLINEGGKNSATMICKKDGFRRPFLIVYSISISASAYWAPVAAVPSDLTSVVHYAMTFSSRSAASVRQMWRRSMAAALMMEAGLA